MFAASMSFFEKPIAARRSSCGSASCSGESFSTSRQKSSPSDHLLKANLMSKAEARPVSISTIFASVKAFRLQRVVVDAGRAFQRAAADRVGDDRLDLGRRVAERRERLRHRPVDDLEVAAAGELLEFHQREVRLDAGRVAIHDEADRAGRRDDGRLGVAIAVLLAERDRALPRRDGALRRGSCPGNARGRAAPGWF